MEIPTSLCDEEPDPDFVPYDGEIPVPFDEIPTWGYPQLTGKEPDYRGIAYACYYKDYILKYDKDYPNVEPIMVAVAISIQGNYYARGLDVGQMEDYCEGKDVSSDGFGIAQITHNQMIDLIGGGSPFNPEDSIHAMYAKIDLVLKYEKVQKSTPTDQMIFAIIAQQNYEWNPDWEIFGDERFYLNFRDRNYVVLWNEYFKYTYINDLIGFTPREILFNNCIAGGRDYQTQFMLQRAVNNLEILSQPGWFDLPAGVSINLLSKYSYWSF